MTRRNVAVLTLLVVAGWLAFVALGRPGSVATAQDPPDVHLMLPLAFRGQARPLARPPTEVPATSTPAATNTPAPTDTPAFTATPSNTPEPTPTPTPEEPLWQAYVNHHRGLARLPRVTANDDWGRGGELHSKYMVKNDVIGHSESPGKPFYTAEGNEAAQNGNVFASSRPDEQVQVPIDMWMTGPFHQLQVLNPRLAVSAFGDYSEADGGIQYGATLDVTRGRVDALPPGVRFPVRYPDEERVIPNLAYEGGESPDPLAYCSGYTVPTGPPLVLLLGGDKAPSVSKVTFRDANGSELPHCWFDEKKVKSPQVANLVLARDHAVVVMPRLPLTAGADYTLAITESGTPHEWTFQAAGNPAPEPGPAAGTWRSGEVVEVGTTRR